ncbi:LppU/SCO3897 family protein [Mycobacteroides abscessus]|uniref:LppU/SCO3897 family protein n=1 Tax=Mycobacteroides abscessus TaxID=36809 RepID=UPI003F8F4396
MGNMLYQANRISLLLLLSTVLFGSAGCGSLASISATANAPIVDFGNIPGQYPDGRAHQINTTSIEPGACVALSGSQARSRIVATDCESTASNYRVVQVVGDPSQCVADVDQKYYHNGADGERTVCLDYAWDGQNCLSIASWVAVRVSCDDIARGDREHPVKLILNSRDLTGCPSGGFPHPIRRFTICTVTQ